jgi:hypothetical protein
MDRVANSTIAAASSPSSSIILGHSSAKLDPCPSAQSRTRGCQQVQEGARNIPRVVAEDASDKATNDEASSSTAAHAAHERMKQEPVKSACVECRKRKTKCSGQRPICRLCRDRGLDCLWDIADGMTKTEDLRYKLQVAVTRLNDLTCLIDAMRSSDGKVPTMLLARLRLGASIEELVHAIMVGQVLEG